MAQQQLDTMVRALKQLPDSELGRLGVDVNTEVRAGSEAADALRRAWQQRQEELQHAMSAVAKPVEHMAEIAQSLQKHLANLTSIDVSINASLIELESLLSDIDNARDFHTIGGWSVLVAYLSQELPPELRALAAWCIGTAVKNDYDFQLWTLEKTGHAPGNITLKVSNRKDESLSSVDTSENVSTDGSTCLDLLVEMLSIFSNPLMIKYALYAISSASHGNVDIQEALLRNSAFMPALKLLADSNDDIARTIDINRKVWTFVADSLKEKVWYCVLSILYLQG